MGEVQAIEAALATQPFGHAPKDLRGDHARVAARPHQRSKTDGPGNAICGLIRDLFALFQRRAGGGEHVRAGIAVGDGEDVQGVDLVDVRCQIGDRGAITGQQTGPIAGSSRHEGRSPDDVAPRRPPSFGRFPLPDVGPGLPAAS